MSLVYVIVLQHIKFQFTFASILRQNQTKRSNEKAATATFKEDSHVSDVSFTISVLRSIQQRPHQCFVRCVREKCAPRWGDLQSDCAVSAVLAEQLFLYLVYLSCLCWVMLVLCCTGCGWKGLVIMVVFYKQTVCE